MAGLHSIAVMALVDDTLFSSACKCASTQAAKVDRKQLLIELELFLIINLSSLKGKLFILKPQSYFKRLLGSFTHSDNLEPLVVLRFLGIVL